METKKHILIVDDVTTNLKVAGDVLKDKYQLSMAKSGAQALEFLKKAKPDLILLDVRMPGMDGYETLEHIKSNVETSNIPVVFLTVDDKRESEIKGLKMGAMDFILKPFEPDIMLSRIEKILQIEDLRKNLSNSAKKDPLTNIWNRKYLEDDMERYFINKNRGVFIIFDVDNFKKANDTYGHVFGDNLLCKFARILENKVGPKDIAARLGGDEFAVFLKGDYTDEEINTYCEMILIEVHRDMKDEQEASYNPTVSIGISVAPEDGTDMLTLYNRADKALYFVKQNGKDFYHYYKQREEYLNSTIDNFNSEQDMNRLENIIKEKDLDNGALRVEYEGFKNIVHFVQRTISRSNQNVWIILLTLTHTGPEKLATEELEVAMNEVERAIVVSLRKGDVTTLYSSFQYVTLLMDASEEDAREIAKRIITTWQDVSNDRHMSLTYNLKNIEAELK
ncbi:MAG: diguanylate cyclase [Lachnospiraceae bacterium]|jgi:diguanylate cyclase (GGDEF)-like protein|nr:diguanylate cyclase [Lachnospiraceae bacterium]MBP5276476.1 diguanylate cyclase [Lachnospiraceae bacterium]MBP5564246.1 diguanylate cyclase [Lachnospiraceae bacterium]MBQ4275269.1 diguanylate cyclase [Lachnospiraceae bacterium]MCR4697493.1 diguanylate cyclase [Lachnospiraceae bacterium]